MHDVPHFERGKCHPKPIMIAFVKPVLTAGAILAQKSDIHIFKNATFVNNSAIRDGGEQ